MARHPGVALLAEPGYRTVAASSRGAYEGLAVIVRDELRSGGAAFAVIAGGTHYLRTPAAKGHSQPFAVIACDGWPHPWARPAVAGAPVTLSGQLCTPKDVLARDVQVRRLRAGDLVAFGLTGAYAWNISHSRFLMHTEPGFHCIGEDVT